LVLKYLMEKRLWDACSLESVKCPTEGGLGTKIKIMTDAKPNVEN